MTRNDIQADGQRRAIGLADARPGEADALLAQADLAVPLEGSINACLVNTGGRLILIDSGAGSLYGDCCGHLLENLRAAGHTACEVTSEGQSLLVWGALVHVAPFQFPDPAITVTYDTDPLSAEDVRIRMFARAARTATWIGAAHIAFPGLGHIRAVGGHFEWVPANYTARLPSTP